MTWKIGSIVRRRSDGAHAEVLRAPDDRGIAIVRFGVAGSMSAPSAALGYRKISDALVDEFEVVK